MKNSSLAPSGERVANPAKRKSRVRGFFKGRVKKIAVPFLPLTIARLAKAAG